jgi:hypothetical protein
MVAPVPWGIVRETFTVAMSSIESVATAISQSHGNARGRLSLPSLRRRSRLIFNPLKAFNLNTRDGRHIRDLVVYWSKMIGGDTRDPLTLGALVSCAELSLRCDRLRRDPLASVDALVKLENLLSRRLRNLGLSGRKLTRLVP